MRSFASLLVVIALGASSSPDVRAETPVPRTIYTETLLQERSLRQEIESTRGETPQRSYDSRFAAAESLMTYRSGSARKRARRSARLAAPP